MLFWLACCWQICASVNIMHSCNTCRQPNTSGSLSDVYANWWRDANKLVEKATCSLLYNINWSILFQMTHTTIIHVLWHIFMSQEQKKSQIHWHYFLLHWAAGYSQVRCYFPSHHGNPPQNKHCCRRNTCMLWNISADELWCQISSVDAASHSRENLTHCFIIQLYTYSSQIP